MDKIWNELVKARIGATPSYVYSPKIHSENLAQWRSLKDSVGIQIFYSLKAQSFAPVIENMMSLVDGFSVSSIFELELVKRIDKTHSKTRLMVSPGLAESIIQNLDSELDLVTANSMNQLEMMWGQMGNSIPSLIRINPEYSVVEDGRYDPCFGHSKLGIPLSQMTDVTKQPFYHGIHFHTHSENYKFEGLLETIKKIVKTNEGLIKNAKKINLGGGYCLWPQSNFEPLILAIEILRGINKDISIIVEPGHGLVHDSLCLLSRVVDKFEVRGKSLLILDTTVNHMPQVFEYQYKHPVLGAKDRGLFNYSICGSSCLAGDCFGEYGFNSPINRGDIVVFPYAGSYTNVKAHTFNGIPLPTFSRFENGILFEQTISNLNDFLKRSGLNV